VVAFLASGVGGAFAQTVDSQDVLWFSDTSDTFGDSFLTRTDTMLLSVIEANGLTPGDAHTIWWIVFNNPGACSYPCGEDDIFDNADPSGLNLATIVAAGIGIGNATGNIAKANGTAEFGSRLVQNDVGTDHQVLFPAGLSGPGVLTGDPHAVEVHLIVQTHSQGRGGPQLLRQLSEVVYGCSSQCADIQFTVHLP
jgi:hypothetical protein